MKLRQTTALILIIVIIILIFTSCTSEVSYIDDVEDKAPLSIYLLDIGFDKLIAHHIETYNSMKPKENRPIEITTFKLEEIEDMYTKILNEISAGKGPDIITINTKTDHYIDVNKISKRNCFADMEILIENSESFDFNDYNKSALDAGIINNKRGFMPITYKVEYLIGIEECFINNNLKIPDELTLDTYLNLLEQYYQNTSNRPVMFGKIEPIYLLSKFFEYGKPLEKSDKLRRLFKLLKIENDRYVANDNPEFSNYDSIHDNYNKFFSNNNLFMRPKNIGYNQFIRLREHYNVIENEFRSNIIIFEEPIDDNQFIKSYIDFGIAININSKHKNEAFDFVQFLLSKNVQSLYNMVDLPVNLECYETEISEFFNSSVNEYDGFISNLVENDLIKIPEKMKNDFIEYIESAETCEYLGSIKFIYHNIMNQSIEDYYNDKLTFDEMIDEINNKLSIYYSE